MDNQGVDHLIVDPLIVQLHASTNRKKSVGVARVGLLRYSTSHSKTPVECSVGRSISRRMAVVLTGSKWTVLS